MAFTFRSAERARRCDPGRTLGRRPDDALPFLDAPVAGQGLLLDTCVYIDQIQGKAPKVLADLLDIRTVNHSMVAVQELMHAVGVLDPRSTGAVAAMGGRSMPCRRTGCSCPARRCWQSPRYRLGSCAGRRATQGTTGCALHDCVLFLQARRLGLTVLTRNVRDFDVLLQIRPDGRALFYRA